MKNIIPDFEWEQDLHTTVENPDFSQLDALYEGRKAYYGDYHAHAATGGRSDGTGSLQLWKAAMDRDKVDFAGIMDHRQVRHMYLDAFDPKYFLYGTEPAIILPELGPGATPHYLMLFQSREDLADKILTKFPEEYKFTGGPEGFFEYKKVTLERFREIAKAVLDADGAFVHAHPKQVLQSDNWENYYYGERTAIEIIYAVNANPVLCKYTIDNYKLWLDMLKNGKHVFNTATTDAHEKPSRILKGINTVYTEKRWGPLFVKKLREGDLNSGFMGIKMSIDSLPVGSESQYRDGMKLYIRIDDIHPKLKTNDEYRVDVITDKGLAYSAPLTPGFSLALNVQKRAFYRAEVIKESDGTPAAIGNPIWLDK